MIVTLKLTKNHNRVPTHRRGVGGRDFRPGGERREPHKCSSRASYPQVIHNLLLLAIDIVIHNLMQLTISMVMCSCY